MPDMALSPQPFDCWLMAGVTPEAFVTACRGGFVEMLDRHMGDGHDCDLACVIEWPEAPAPEGDGWLAGELVAYVPGSVKDLAAVGEALFECLDVPFVRLCEHFQGYEANAVSHVLAWRPCDEGYDS